MMTLNHVLIRTRNLKRMIRFFEQALELNNGKRPPFPFAGAWLWSGDQPIIHLSEALANDDDEAMNQSGTGMIDHIAFGGTDYPSLINRLQQHDIRYFETTIPSTGEQQVFIEAPEGLKVEVQFMNASHEEA